MPLIIAALWGAFISMLGTLVGRVLVSLGIGYVTYTGVDLLLTWARTAFLSGLSGLPAAAVQMAGVLKVGVCVSMLLSAITTRMVLAGLQGGTSMRKMVQK